jgi:DNA (cytosine-5)-methyltransferase 1
LEGESSGLYYNGLNILQEKKPKYSIIENVDNLASKKYKPVLDQILKDLNEAGYNNYYRVLNAYDYGIPQHRRRIFIISIRKDIQQEFEFPELIHSNLKFEDLLEKEVNTKYYLSKKEREYMDRQTRDGRDHWDCKHYHDTENTYSHCITANMYKGVPYNVLVDRRKCWRYDCDFIDQDEEFCKQCTEGDSYQRENYPTSGIRKMIPLECFRLMGFDDRDCIILKENKISDTQLFKMAGNSIVVNVLEEIFKKLFIEYIRSQK